jgi:GNAT superfamily N-acetyltransferase
VIGFLSIRKHNAFSAESHVVGVLPQYHRQGVGKALLARAEKWLSSDGIEYLQVKTLGPSHPDADYERTRKFYEAVGFRPLEEFTMMWGPTQPCLVMVKKLG